MGQKKYMKDKDKIKHIFDSQNHAENYDEKARKSNWVAPEVVFGLSYAWIKPGETILDIGIGTGLSSVLFHKAGLFVYGMDCSKRMLKICAEKKIAKDLKYHNLVVTPYPYEDNSIDHAVSTGVFHLFSDLSFIFKEVNRILKSKGFFVFCVMDYKEKEGKEIIIEDRQIPGKSVTVYRYNESEIQILLDECSFRLIKSADFMGIHANNEIRFRACMVQKI